jgi:putative SOS response-associated peptidase YedK
LDKRLTTLEQLIIQRLDALHRELAEIQQVQQTASQSSHARQTKPSTMPTGRKKPAQKTPIIRKRAKKARVKKLPQGLVPLTVFRQAHGISEKAVDYARDKKRFTVERGKWMQDGKVIMIALSRQGQHEFIELFRERPEFQRCNECPHAL